MTFRSRRSARRGNRPVSRVLAALASALMAIAPAAAGAAEGQGEPGVVTVELNKLAPRASGDEEIACRAYLVLKNGARLAFASLKLDMVMFDADGVVAKRLAVETAPLPPGKTSLKVFDIAGQPCADIGRVLLNGVLDCRDRDGARNDCLGLIAPSARGAVPFIK